jgi:hypothetical protein
MGKLQVNGDIEATNGSMSVVASATGSLSTNLSVPSGGWERGWYFNVNDM